MRHLTPAQLGALRAADRRGGIIKTGTYWHAANHDIFASGGYRPDRANVFTNWTVKTLHNQGLLTGGGLITTEGREALATRKRAAVDGMEAAVSAAAVDAVRRLKTLLGR